MFMLASPKDRGFAKGLKAGIKTGLNQSLLDDIFIDLDNGTGMLAQPLLSFIRIEHTQSTSRYFPISQQPWCASTID
jgi:hypothetical protein